VDFRILQLLFSASGLVDLAACSDGLHPTFRRDNHPETRSTRTERQRRFRSSTGARARRKARALIDEVVEIADDSSLDFRFVLKDDASGESAKAVVDREHIDRSKLRIRTRFEYAAKMHRKKFGEKAHVKLTDADDKPLTFTLNIGDAGPRQIEYTRPWVYLRRSEADLEDV
jgi:hypothetical protein